MVSLQEVGQQLAALGGWHDPENEVRPGAIARGPLLVLVGNEGKGLRPEVQEHRSTHDVIILCAWLTLCDWTFRCRGIAIW